MAGLSVHTVSTLTRYIRHRLEGDPSLHGVAVTGEVSNLVAHGSGHVYFTLKDAEAQLSCALFKAVAMQFARRMPVNGERITVQGDITVYPPRGNYQMIVRALVKDGQDGDLHKRFLELKARLAEEGLFDPARKRPLPGFPRRIGIATSPTGAVIRDICNTLRRRFPHVEVLVAPTVVQGDQAVASIVNSMALLNRTPRLDLIILARGGGSLEDLWAFNEEAVARAVAASCVPVITAVGHETDTTIVDFVADKRAATPTAAAELAVPSAAHLLDELSQAQAQLERELSYFVQTRRQSLDALSDRLESAFGIRLELQRRHLNDAARGLDNHLANAFRRARHELELAEANLEALDMRQVLERGYSMTQLGDKLIRDAADLAPGDVLTTYFYQGKARSRVETTDSHA